MIKFTNRTIPVSALRISKLNWDRDVTNEGIAALAASIEETGNINPITARPVGKAGHMYEVIAGRRRYLAQKSLGLTKVEARVAKLSDLDAEIFSYSENLQIERPDSIAWAQGVKRLVDLFEKRNFVGKPKKTKKATITKDLNNPEFSAAVSLNSGRGRRASPRQKAIKDVAKTTNTSPKTVRKAVKRAEDLIPSAVRALELDKITQGQADRLAKMRGGKQQVELRNMILESRDETRQRVSREAAKEHPNETEAISFQLGYICYEFDKIKKKIDLIMELAKDEDLDRAGLLKVPRYSNLEIVRDALTDLLEVIED